MAAFGSSGDSGRNPNNGMHPTGNSVDVIRKAGCSLQCFPAGDAERYVSASRCINEDSRRASIECCRACVDNARGGVNEVESRIDP